MSWKKVSGIVCDKKLLAKAKSKMYQRQTSGHKVRLVIHEKRKEDYVGKRMIEMVIPGKRRKGRPKRRCVDFLREDMEMAGAREGDEVDRVLCRRLSRCCDPA